MIQNEFHPCECCKPKYVNMTFTGTCRKWTKKEIQEEILHFAQAFSHAKWYEKGYYKERLKHWTKKLERFNELQEEFIN